MQAVVGRDVAGIPVRFGDVPESVPEPFVDRPLLQANRTEALLRLPEVGVFHVGPCEVVVRPVDGVPPGLLDTMLDGTVTALVLAQRGRFALHASTVRLGGRLVAVAGPRGVGKSTTVGLLAGRGHPVVTDDVTAVGPDGHTVAVMPTGRRLRLFPATAARLGYDLADGEPTALGNGKYAFPFAAPVDAGPQPLGLIVALGATEVATPVVRALDRIAGADVVLTETYRPLVRALRPVAYLQWVAAVAAAVPVVRIDRPAHGWSGDAVATAVEDAVALYA